MAGRRRRPHQLTALRKADLERVLADTQRALRAGFPDNGEEMFNYLLNAVRGNVRVEPEAWTEVENGVIPEPVEIRVLVQSVNEQERDRARAIADEQIGELTESAAENMLRARYWRSVRSHGTDIVERIRSNEITDEDELTEAIDSAGEIIYTKDAYWTMQFTSSDDAYFDSYGDSISGDSAATILTTLATHAHIQDVREQVEAEMGMSFDDFLESLESDEEEPEE